MMQYYIDQMARVSSRRNRRYQRRSAHESIQAVSINLVGGNMFSRTQVEGLVANLKQYQTDGGTLLIK